MADYPSVRAAEEAKSRAEFHWTMAQLDRLRRSGKDVGHRADFCPCCGHGLRKRVFPEADTTMFYCQRCSWIKSFPFAMDEGRTLDEEFTSGVTGRTKGTTVVVLDASGKNVLGVSG